ncbi:MAG: AraC family transcriptional regulator [Alphaproteobacteria bacterium]|nr:AraC family transcriptional regulator [Alphaproteobacteria bacterium]
MLTNPLPTNTTSANYFSNHVRSPSQPGILLSIDQRTCFGNARCGDGEAAGFHDRASSNVTNDRVQIAPCDAVKRRAAVTGDGMTVEIVQATRRDRIEYRYRGPLHVLAAYEQGMRRDGETLVEGLPPSQLRDFRNKLTFVPAGHEYRESQALQSLSRTTYFYFDPAKMPFRSETGVAELAPRLYFEDAALWDTALKLSTSIESGSTDNRLYLEALGVVLAHELVRLNASGSRAQGPIRGGLAAWQQRVVTGFIEEHVAEQIPLARLAQLVRLSPYHFCRAFKQSFGIPPHRYHTSRRIEQAKTLLAEPAPSVTDIGLTVGFSQTSSFTAAFRRATGLTPTGYHRSLG